MTFDNNELSMYIILFNDNIKKPRKKLFNVKQNVYFFNNPPWCLMTHPIYKKKRAPEGALLQS